MLINAPAKPSHIKAIISSPLLRSEEGQFFSIFRYLEDVIVATLARSGRYKRVFFAEYETQPCYPFYIISDISTHTPLTGNNSTLTPVSKLRSTFQSTLSSLRAIQNGQQHQPSDYFNPRSPHRERQNQTIQREIVVKFQSSLPSQGATNKNANGSY